MALSVFLQEVTHTTKGQGLLFGLRMAKDFGKVEIQILLSNDLFSYSSCVIQTMFSQHPHAALHVMVVFKVSPDRTSIKENNYVLRLVAASVLCASLF